MIQKIKTNLCALARSLGYSITDTNLYKEDFPWLMVRTGYHTLQETLDTRLENIDVIIDIFSIYKGEKEILNIASNLTNHIQQLKQSIPDITYIHQKDLKILDDNSTGPVKKHGVLIYAFKIASNLKEGE